LNAAKAGYPHFPSSCIFLPLPGAAFKIIFGNPFPVFVACAGTNPYSVIATFFDILLHVHCTFVQISEALCSTVKSQVFDTQRSTCKNCSFAVKSELLQLSDVEGQDN